MICVKGLINARYNTPAPTAMLHLLCRANTSTLKQCLIVKQMTSS